MDRQSLQVNPYASVCYAGCEAFEDFSVDSLGFRGGGELVFEEGEELADDGEVERVGLLHFGGEVVGKWSQQLPSGFCEGVVVDCSHQ